MQRRSFMKAAFLVFGLLAALSPAAAAPAVDDPEDEFYYRIVRFSTFYLEGRNCERIVDALDALYEESYNVETMKIIFYFRGECRFRMGHYFLARENYEALKLLVDSTADPLYARITARLDAIGKKEKYLYLDEIKKKVNLFAREPRRHLPKIGAALLFAALLTLFFRHWSKYYDEERRFFRSFRNGFALFLMEKSFLSFFVECAERIKAAIHPCPAGKGEPRAVPVIVPEDKLIKLTDMMRQDGRVPESTVQDYTRFGLDGVRNRYVKLIVDAHEMIGRLNRCIPYPLALVAKFPLCYRRRWFWPCTTFGFLLIGTWTLLSSLEVALFLNEGTLIQSWGDALTGNKYHAHLFSRFLLATVFIADLYGLKIMAGRTIESVDELATLIENQDSLARLESWIRSLFKTPWQLYVAAILISIFIAKKLLHDDLLIYTNVVFTVVLIVLGSPLIWFLIQGVRVTHNISNMNDLETNPLSPLKTFGLQKWIGVIGTYAMVGSIILTFGACLPIISDVFKGEPYTLDQLIWLAVFTPLLVVVWIYPYVKLRALVKRIKQQRMHFFKNQISQAFTEWFQAEHNIRREQKRNLHMAEDFATVFNKRVKMREMIKPQIDQVSTFHGFFKEIDRSPESFFDFYSVLELAKIMGIPSIFALLSYLFNF